MSKIIIGTAITLNGVMESPEKWQFPFYSNDISEYEIEQVHLSDALLLGRKTYEMFSSFWPTRTNNEYGIADKFNSTKKYVVSTSLKEASWNNSEIISNNIIERITQLKKASGNFISVVGSQQLVATLIQNNLADEIRLMVNPVILCSGKILFENINIDKTLKLIDTKTFSSGVVLLVYQPTVGN
jgi:dihydrofolate reductase